jgi:hypothetical protein
MSIVNMDIEKEQKKKDRIKRYNKLYYEKNKERLKQKSNDNYKNNNDHYKKQQKEYYYKKSEGVKRRRKAEQMQLRKESIFKIIIGDMVFVLDESEIQ